MALKLCVAQLNLTVGDMTGNAQKIIAAAQSAYAQGARLVLTPELSICGYPAEDLLLRPALLSHRDEPLLEAPQRFNSVYFHYPWSESERVGIEIPDGYKVEQLPDSIDIDIGAARYHASFAREGHRVVYERRLIVNAINFTADQYQTVKAFFDRALQADRTAISFKQ